MTRDALSADTAFLGDLRLRCQQSAEACGCVGECRSGRWGGLAFVRAPRGSSRRWTVL